MLDDIKILGHLISLFICLCVCGETISKILAVSQIKNTACRALGLRMFFRPKASAHIDHCALISVFSLHITSHESHDHVSVIVIVNSAWTSQYHET